MAHSVLVSRKFRKRSVTIEQQLEHHRTPTFQESIYPTLRNTAHIFDVKYLWDVWDSYARSYLLQLLSHAINFLLIRTSDQRPRITP
jgi:hypothetical protein